VTLESAERAEEPLISVIVPVRNGLPWLEDQLTALVAQQCPEAWEVVVADNGSSDLSRSVVQGFADLGHRVGCVDASAVRGPAAARNAGVRAAEGELLAFCDADDVVQPGWLAACVKALGDADIAGGVFDSWSLNGVPAPSPKVFAVPPALRQFGFLPAGLSSNLAVRREAFDEVHGFAEDLTVGEDTDLCWRMQLRGYRFVVAEDAVVARRDRSGFAKVLVRFTAYGRCGPVLYRRYRESGQKRELAVAAKSWVWLVWSIPRLAYRDRRIKWAEIAGWRAGRLFESIKQGVFFP
jgi:glycosyltransferase involved in cell wall biosynthesis